MRTARRGGIMVKDELTGHNSQNWRKGGLSGGDIPGNWNPSAPHLSQYVGMWVTIAKGEQQYLLWEWTRFEGARGRSHISNG